MNQKVKKMKIDAYKNSVALSINAEVGSDEINYDTLKKGLEFICNLHGFAADVIVWRSNSKHFITLENNRCEDANKLEKMLIELSSFQTRIKEQYDLN